jgi:hypothetical protein
MATMKFLLATALFLSASDALAVPANRWGFGPLAGVNLSNADLEGPDDRGIVGWALGGRLELGVNRLLSVNTDPMLIRHGAEFDPSPDAGNFEARGQFYMVEIPMFLKARASLFNLGVHAFAGPSASFLWDASGQLDQEHSLNGTDASMVGLSGDIGVGSSFEVAPRLEVTADARYSHGFTDLLEQGVGEVGAWRTRDLRLVLGVILHGS